MELKRKLKSIVLKKKDGRVDKQVSLTLSMMVMSIMLIMMSNTFNDMEAKNNIEHVGRNYMLRIESNGYLDKEDERGMIGELQALGVTNINTTGTTKSKLGYGKQCNLNVNGKYNLTVLDVINIFNVEENKEAVDISIDKKSTSKY